MLTSIWSVSPSPFMHSLYSILYTLLSALHISSYPSLWHMLSQHTYRAFPRSLTPPKNLPLRSSTSQQTRRPGLYPDSPPPATASAPVQTQPNSSPRPLPHQCRPGPSSVSLRGPHQTPFSRPRILPGPDFLRPPIPLLLPS